MCWRRLGVALDLADEFQVLEREQSHRPTFLVGQQHHMTVLVEHSLEQLGDQRLLLNAYKRSQQRPHVHRLMLQRRGQQIMYMSQPGRRFEPAVDVEDGQAGTTETDRLPRGVGER
ncbi:MAG: hypothetical protein JO168_05435 [Solirubrobacterales bacterium]|nr:hypothetical protein [Solirubrobacterales bacterium]